MRWLIIEDSLESRRGHWFEYLKDFHRELPRLGDEVTLLVSRRAEPFIQKRLGAFPRLPESMFLKMSDGSPLWRRYVRIPVHAWTTFWAVRKYLRSAPEPHVIFVPTVIVHHLLAWTALVKFALRSGNARLLLFFPGLPVRRTAGDVALDGSPTSKLMRKLLRWLGPEIHAGKVILGVETQAMKHAAEQVFNLPFTYFPHPVTPCMDIGQRTTDDIRRTMITMGFYGSARHEKGCQRLAAAVAEYGRRDPDSRVRFALQCVEGNDEDWRPLEKMPNVKLIRNYFGDGEYDRQFQATQVLLLPYRRSSYALRVSRVVIEAMVNGIPVVATRGTTLAEQAEQFGAAVLCDDENVESLVAAIETTEQNYESLAAKARERQALAREHFSIEYFRAVLVANVSSVGGQEKAL